jgi:hypothetical protein
MRVLLAIIIVIAALWAIIDVVALDGRYSDSFWRVANHQAQQFKSEMNRWVSKISP